MERFKYLCNLFVIQMKLNDFDINKIRITEKKTKVLSVRVTRRDFEWIKKNRISATKLFNYALHKIMKEGKNAQTNECYSNRKKS